MKSVIPNLLSAAILSAPLVILPEANASRCYTGFGASYGKYSRDGSSFSFSSGSGGYRSFGYNRYSYPSRDIYYKSRNYYRPSYRSFYHYYKPSRHMSVSIGRPYVGAYYSSLSRGYDRCYVGGQYYRPYNTGYVVVDNPYVSASRPTTVVRRSVSSKYDSYPRIWASGEECLIDEGDFFKITENGLVWAELPLGSVASYLPTHASSVWYKVIEYFEAGGIYFQRIPEGYKIIFPPWDEEY